MEFAVIFLTISLLFTILLYYKERKRNSFLEEQKQKLEKELAALQATIKQAKDFEQFLKNQVNAYLAQTNKEILTSAKENIKDQLDRHQANLEKVIEPFRQIINRYDQAVREYFEKSTGKFGQLDQALKQLQQTSQQLKNETNRLVELFRNSQQRGKWGEFQLEQMLQFAGLQPGVHYFAQDTQGNRQRPDFIIFLPDGRRLVIDVKTPLNDFYRYIQAQDEAQKSQLLKNHVAAIRSMIRNLSSKNYRESVENSFDYVILYIPIEAAFTLAIYDEPNLYNEALSKSVILASPSTLLPLLHIIHLLWQQSEAIKNVEQIIRQASTLHERYAEAVGELDKLGKKLQEALKAYNAFIAKWEEKVTPAAQKLEQMGVSSKKQLPQLKQLDS